MTQVLFGTKKNMTEAYVGSDRVAVTRIALSALTVVNHKTATNDGYDATQVVFGKGRKHPSKATVGHLKKSGVKSGTMREVPTVKDLNPGQVIKAEDVVKPGTIFSVQGVSKGKGFAGVVKRWGFSGGAKTHGQSDRHRAPGSIGQGTTPGRVHRGKKMAGRMGGDTITIKNILCLAVSGDDIWVTGPIPGSKSNHLRLTITGEQDSPKVTYLSGFDKPSAPVEDSKESNEKLSTNEADAVKSSDDQVAEEATKDEGEVKEVKAEESASATEEKS